MIRQTLPLLLVLAPIAARAQNPAPPAVLITPTIIASGAQIQVPVPPNADKPRLQIVLAGSNAVLDDERANVQNGVATARLEADPGTYDVRVVSNDKTRVPLGSFRRFQIPGFKREAGRWLFNGAAVVYEGSNPPTLAAALPNLRRDKKTKLPVSVSTTTPVKWDIASFGAEFANTVGAGTPDAASTRASFAQRQSALDASNAKGALLLSEPFARPVQQPLQEAYIDALAPLVNGIVIDCTGPVPDGENVFQDYLSNLSYKTSNPLLKVARRNVEETPNFDLPVFARFADTYSDSQMLRAFQDGASNIIVPEGRTTPFLDVLSRQSGRFAGAVTLEDVGLQINDFDRFAPILRRAGRVPLLGRLPGDGNAANKDDNRNAESLIISFDASTTLATLDKIDQAARRGATIYCEGTLPSALLSKWADITKTQISELPAPKAAIVTLSEPWFWGTLNDQTFDATQSVTITPKPSMSSQANEVKGEARETIARPLARFNDGPNAIMLCPTSKGRIIWAPFDVLQDGTGSLRVAYYSAIAGAMQASLVNYTATTGDASAVSVALRAIPADPNNPKSSAVSLVAFFNSANTPVDLNALVRGDGTYALDLMNDQMLPLKVRDYSGAMSLQVPANGFRWIAIAKDAQAWNDAAKNGVKAQLK